MSFMDWISQLSPGSILSGIGSIIGMQQQQKAVEQTNQTNLQIARENNANNERLVDKQNEWNLQQWNRQNEYNSPSAEMQRLMNAGLNPTFYGLNGNAAGPIQTASPIPSTMPLIQNPNQLTAENLQGALSHMISSETELNELIKNKFTLKNDIELSNISVKLGKANLKVTEKQFEKLGQEINNLQKTFELTSAQINKIDADQMYQERDVMLREYQNILATRRLEFEQEKFAKELGVACFNAITNRQVGDSQVTLNGIQAKFIKTQEGLLKLQLDFNQAIQDYKLGYKDVLGFIDLVNVMLNDFISIIPGLNQIIDSIDPIGFQNFTNKN